MMNKYDQRKRSEETIKSISDLVFLLEKKYVGTRITSTTLEEIEHDFNEYYELIRQSKDLLNLGKLKIKQLRDSLYLDLDRKQKELLGLGL